MFDYKVMIEMILKNLINDYVKKNSSPSNNTTVRLDDDVRKRLEEISNATNLSASDIMRTAIADYLERADKSGVITIPIPPKKK